MHVINAIDEHAITTAIELLVQLAKLVELSSFVKVLDALRGEVPLEAFDEVVILDLERVPVGKITSAQANSE